MPGLRRASGCQADISLHAARLARSNMGPRIVRVPSPLCPMCLCPWVQCVASSATAAPATHAAALGAHASVPLHVLEHAAGCMRRHALRLRAFHWHVCACVQILSGLRTG